MIKMKRKKIYIRSAQQISMQQPLSESWMDAPEQYDEPFVKSLNPPLRDYMAANEARRMGNLMKRALVTTLKVLQVAGVEHPDAIITGTALGSLDYTERLLMGLNTQGEEAFSPTYFMQSTHNTVGSSLGIYTKSNGYNATYSHSMLSFDLTVLDAWMQFQLGKINTALIGGHEEMVESYFRLLQKTGYVGQKGMVPCGEVAMEMLLTDQPDTHNLCELGGIRICQAVSDESLVQTIRSLLIDAGLSIGDLQAVMTGKNGNPKNDCYYDKVISLLGSHPSLLYSYLSSLSTPPCILRYKHLFGENFTASALGLYAAAHCLHQQRIPAHMVEKEEEKKQVNPKNILLINHKDGREYSFILLKRQCC